MRILLTSVGVVAFLLGLALYGYGTYSAHKSEPLKWSELPFKIITNLVVGAFALGLLYIGVSMEPFLRDPDPSILRRLGALLSAGGAVLYLGLAFGDRWWQLNDRLTVPVLLALWFGDLLMIGLGIRLYLAGAYGWYGW